MRPLKTIYYTIAFLLEIGMVAAFFIFGYGAGFNTFTRFLFGIGLGLLIIAYWGIFQAPRSARRLGLPLRMICEIALFSVAAFMLYKAGYKTSAVIFGAAALFKEALSFVFKEG